MSKWIELDEAEREVTAQAIAKGKGIDPESVEKDWWVTTVLKTLFGLAIGKYAYFKGGTSLSKGWNLINRFSEDIDIALYRDFFLKEKGVACARCENNNQIKLLRKASRDYVLGELRFLLEEALVAAGLDVKVDGVNTHMTVRGETPIDHDADPTVLLVRYPSIFANNHTYVKPVVKVEISCLSMKEPFEVRHIASLISEEFADEDNETVCDIATISPARTFLEKAFLLNEEFQRRSPRTMRMSRHLYDLEKLMDSSYGKEALADGALYRTIVEHRRKFYHVSGVDYDMDMPEQIAFCPQGDLLERFRVDYDNMKSSFIYGNSLDFETLIKRLEELQGRFRAVGV